MDRWGAQADPLARARTAGLAFSLVALASGLQLDHALSIGRLAAALTAGFVLLFETFWVWLRARHSWRAALLGGPLLVVQGQALAQHPTMVAVALGILAGHSLYGDRRLALARLASILAAFPTLLIVSRMMDSPDALTLALLAVPVPVLIMFALLLRALYQALRRQQDSARREALLATTSRSLMGVTDADRVSALVWQAAVSLCDLTAGLGLAVIETRDGLDVVRHAAGALDAPVGEAFDGRPAQAMPWGSTPDRRLVATAYRTIQPEIRDLLDTLDVQLCQAEAICAAHGELLTLAHQDRLTGLANRGAFLAQLAEAVDSSAGRETRVALLSIDLDDFKLVNDTLGHAAGDAVLVEVAHRMSALTGRQGLPARFGGDEFAVLIVDAQDQPALGRFAADLRDRLIEPIEWEGETLQVGASIGVMTGRAQLTAGDLLRCADIAMYSAKTRGKNQVVAFSDEQHSTIAQLRLMEAHLPQAVARQEIVLHYQPVIELRSGRCVGVEALARWDHPSLGTIHPNTFIPLAERQGRIRELGSYLLIRACEEIMSWALPPQAAPLRLALNVSARQLAGGDFARVVGRALSASGLPADRLTLEITEIDFPHDEKSLSQLRSVRELGVSLALDDFGSGLMPFTALQASGVQQLKLDSRLAAAGTQTADDLASMVSAVSELLGMQTVAQGVENAQQQTWATDHGLALAQGALFCGGIPAAELITWLDARGWSGGPEPLTAPASPALAGSPGLLAAPG